MILLLKIIFLCDYKNNAYSLQNNFRVQENIKPLIRLRNNPLLGDHCCEHVGMFLCIVYCVCVSACTHASLCIELALCRTDSSPAFLT